MDKTRRRDEDEKICGDDGGAGIKWRSINGKQEAGSSWNGDMSFVPWHSRRAHGWMGGWIWERIIRGWNWQFMKESIM